MIDRRNALAGIASMFGAALFAPIARAAAAGGIEFGDGPPSSAIFTDGQRAVVGALSERIIPTTDTPGAIAAGVPEYIEKLLVDWSLPEERVPVLKGLEELDAYSVQHYGQTASKIGEEQQDAVLNAATANEFSGGGEFFLLFRQLVITGYYTSEIGITQEREYLPVPGEYDGAYLYSNINKVFSS